MAMSREQPHSRLPWPAEWRSRRVRSVVLVFILALLAAGSLVRGTVYVIAGNYRGGPLLLGLALLLLAVAATTFLTRLRVRNRGVESIHLDYVSEIEQPAVVIPYAWMLGAATCLALLAMIPVFGIPAIVTGLILAESGWRDPGVMVIFVFFSLIVLCVLAFVVEILLGRLVRGRLALGPTRIHHRSWAFSSCFPWEGTSCVMAVDAAIPFIATAVLDEADSYYRRTSRLWKQRELVMAPHLGLKGHYLSVDPALAYHALRYYHEHPEARSELGTSVGVDRLRRAEVVG